MVFEQFLASDSVKKNFLFIFLLGIFYVFVGYFVSAYFFEEQVSVAMLFTITLLLVPSISIILNIEEKIESKAGVKHFFHNHKDIFKIYFSLFKGIFVAFLILGAYSQLSMFDYQLDFLQSRGDLTGEIINEFSANEYNPTVNNAIALISQNLLVVIIAFILSIFYGAGALFLIVLNASVFASFIIYVIKEAGNALQLISIFLIHLIPELAGFLVAAIAGGVVSRAIVREEFGSQGFRNVMKDALVLLAISAVLIIIAAFLEIFVSANLVKLVI
ncbi:stage II sporulation protein M [Candidatus Woesearchaeota archaeon]|nr:stage II sporulation protein M [Candidatus Woesearchaeota archaeon]